MEMTIKNMELKDHLIKEKDYIIEINQKNTNKLILKISYFRY